MTSYKKESNEFTRNPTGGRIGESEGLKRSKGANVGGGGTILEAYGQDNVHGVPIEGDTVDSSKMAGSPTNLSHSLTGASAVPRQKGKVEHSGI